ncbi:hypothetical protein C8R43DRAFT_949222 [Mycena crocata]|nr:hypothetical protein C8R43DRAFT_949222 [Mycena crocata]
MQCSKVGSFPRTSSHSESPLLTLFFIPIVSSKGGGSQVPVKAGEWRETEDGARDADATPSNAGLRSEGEDDYDNEDDTQLYGTAFEIAMRKVQDPSVPQQEREDILSLLLVKSTHYLLLFF